MTTTTTAASKIEGAKGASYSIRTIRGRGLPTGTDADGYDTRLAAEEMADAFHDGEYEIVEEIVEDAAAAR